MKVLIVGRGRIGSMLLRTLRAAKVDVRAQSSRNRVQTDGRDVVVLAVRDPALEAISESVARTVRRGSVVLHCAGSQGTGVLSACAAKGAAVGVMHPLVSVADRTRAPGLGLTTFVIAGNPKARRVATKLAKLVGARAIVANVHGPLYHAAAVMLVGGTLSTLLDSVEMATASGMKAKDATRAMIGLMLSVIENVVVRGAARSLTGPVVRADVATLRAHLLALRGRGESERAYRAMSERMIHVATQAGLSKTDGRSLRAALLSKKHVENRRRK